MRNSADTMPLIAVARGWKALLYFSYYQPLTAKVVAFLDDLTFEIICQI